MVLYTFEPFLIRELKMRKVPHSHLTMIVKWYEDQFELLADYLLEAYHYNIRPYQIWANVDEDDVGRIFCEIPDSPDDDEIIEFLIDPDQDGNDSIIIDQLEYLVTGSRHTKQKYKNKSFC